MPMRDGPVQVAPVEARGGAWVEAPVKARRGAWGGARVVVAHTAVVAGAAVAIWVEGRPRLARPARDAQRRLRPRQGL